MAEGCKIRLMEMDEFPRPDVTAEKLAKLNPVFRKSGRVTLSNSSGVTSGASCVVVSDRAALEPEGVALVVQVDRAIVGVPPRIMG